MLFLNNFLLNKLVLISKVFSQAKLRQKNMQVNHDLRINSLLWKYANTSDSINRKIFSMQLQITQSRIPIKFTAGGCKNNSNSIGAHPTHAVRSQVRGGAVSGQIYEAISHLMKHRVPRRWLHPNEDALRFLISPPTSTLETTTAVAQATNAVE